LRYMFSKACEYGIRAAIYIALRSIEGQRSSLKDIAIQISSPEAFTAKILQQLVRSGIIQSAKGPAGGFEIPAERMEAIRLSHIVAAIDGDSIYKGCGLGLKECSEKKPCPMHHQFKEVREGLRKMLENTSIYELSQGLKNGHSFLRHQQETVND